MSHATDPRAPTAHIPGAPADLAGRHVLVTGAASGIGRACAEAFAYAKSDMTLLDRDAKQLQEVADELGATVIVADLTDPSSLVGIEDHPIDIVVNSAGFQHVASIEDFDPDTFNQILRLMVEAPFRLAHQLLPGMYRRGWGRFIHISSVHGYRASAYKSAYVTAKHGLEGLSKAIAVEGAPHGVTSNTICPGYVRTSLVENQITDQAAAHDIAPDQVLHDVLLSHTPIKRLIEPDEVARLATFLCGPGTDSLSGAAYEMSGAWTAT